ncbi:ArsR family transcriptional regulator [Psychromonas sp. MME2]|uniref:VpaChn25_0724 family phage protein n=1 Tax=unclassified Psychromonas TaxID=2614957 RepID=UPI00339BA8AC
MSMKQIMQEHQRLVVLRLLSEDLGYDLNESILQDGLGVYSLSISRDALRTQLAWLEEQDCIELTVLQNGTHLAKLTSRGLDVAKGLAIQPGIKRPRPGE